MDLMGSNQVWTLIDPPKGPRPVGCKWVYKCKFRDDGEVMAFKARLVAKGYIQRLGVNFEETCRFRPGLWRNDIFSAWVDFEETYSPVPGLQGQACGGRIYSATWGRL
ncbi:UNVERIFIED_CONTAM: hypothetical protein Sradi_6860400 [Sesamum radiatum]|uniref:Reverse transcriptase Ty1/copia-type domain-containing protein n=1 Tax=Sesamum radiatum TaxID=300843 RepID=A0AAW2JMN4_SESRA